MTQPTTRTLTSDEIQQALATLHGWDIEGDKLHRRFEFRDFRAAFGFMTAVATIAEGMDHHPEWLNVYRTVEVWLTTHSAGGITQKDVDLARAMEERAPR